MRDIPQLAFDFAKGAEAFVAFVYDDAHFPPKPMRPGQLADGTATGGYGHTGPGVQPGMAVPKAMALDWLKADLEEARRRLYLRVHTEAIDALSEHQYAALLVFVLNAGAGAWHIWDSVNAGRLGEVPGRLLEFDHGKVWQVVGGKRVKVSVVIPGLLHRRQAEIALWSAPDVARAVAIVQSAPVQPPPSSVTRAMETPPQVEAGSAAKKGGMVAGAVGAVCTVGAQCVQGAQGAIKGVSDAVSPFADKSEQIGQVVQWLAMGAAGLAVAGIALVWLDHWRKRHQPGGAVA